MDRHIEVQQLARVNVVDPSVNLDAGVHLTVQRRHPLVPVILDHGVLDNVLNLLADTRLSQHRHKALAQHLIRHGVTLAHTHTQVATKVHKRRKVALQCTMQSHFGIVRLLVKNLLDGRRDATARCVTDDNDMLYAQTLDSECQGTHSAVIMRLKLIRNVAQNKQLAGSRIAHDTLGHTRITASNPKNLGVLALAQS